MIQFSKLQYFIVVILFLTVNFISNFTQERINVNDGKGWDGVEYFEIAKKFSEGTELSGPAPLVYRVGTPFLASLIDKNDLLNGFFIANLIANFLSVLLLFIYLKMFLKNIYVVFALIIFFLFHWMCNTRFIYYYPSITDPWGVTFLLAGLILIERVRKNSSNVSIILLCIISFIGVLFREFVIMIPLAYLFINDPFDKTKLCFIDWRKLIVDDKKKLLPLVAGLLGILVTRLITTDTSTDYSFLKTTIYFIYNKSLVQYIHAWFFAAGPVVIVLIYFYKNVFRFISENQYLLILLIGAIVVSYTGGSDTGRLILWFVPLILLLEGIVIEENLSVFRKPLLILCIIVFQIFSMKALITIPQPISNPETVTSSSITEMKDIDPFDPLQTLRNMDPLVLSFIKYLIAVTILIVSIRIYTKKVKLSG